MKKLILLLMIVCLFVASASAAGLRYKGSGPWQDVDPFGTEDHGWWLSATVPGSLDSARLNWGGGTVTLDYAAPDIVSLQIGVDESGNLIVNAGGSLTTISENKVGNNGTCTGTLVVNAGGTFNSGGGWLMIAGNSDVTGVVDVTGTLNVEGHLWCATGAGATATIDINSGGVITVAGMIGLGTVNATSASGGTATLNVNDGGLLALSAIHPDGTSIQPGSRIDIIGTGVLTIPDTYADAIANYIAAGKIVGDGIVGNLIVDLTIKPGFAVVIVSEPVCISPPTMDTNDDCRIDLIDLAVFVSEWLTCGLDYQFACW